VRPPLGLAGLVSVELATERLVASLPEDHPLAGRESLGVADVLPEPIIAARFLRARGETTGYSPTTVRTGASGRRGEHPRRGDASRLQGVGLSIMSEAAGLWYKRPGVNGYAKCISGRDAIARQRIEDALRGDDPSR
jgi:DNA-binding transcriptional LysR family regulator